MPIDDRNAWLECEVKRLSAQLEEKKKFDCFRSIPPDIKANLGQPLSLRLRQYTQSQIPVHQDRETRNEIINRTFEKEYSINE